MTEDPNRLAGPLLRSDVVAIACFGLAAYSLISSTWPVIAGLGVVGGILAGLSPRMEGRWGLHGGGFHAGGQFVKLQGEFEARPSARAQPPHDQREPDQPELPPSRQSGSG